MQHHAAELAAGAKQEAGGTSPGDVPLGVGKRDSEDGLRRRKQSEMRESEMRESSVDAEKQIVEVCYTVVTRLLHGCYTVVTRLLHGC
jgi:hypothetical protein